MKVTKVTTKKTEITTEHQKLPKIRRNSANSFLFARRAKKALANNKSPPQELEISLCSRLYLLVAIKLDRVCPVDNRRKEIFKNHVSLTKSLNELMNQ